MTKFQPVVERSQLMLEGKSSLHPIQSATHELTGYFVAQVNQAGQLDLAQPATGRLEVAIESMKAGNDLYDLEMRRRLDIRRYPTIVAELTELRAQSQPNHYHAVGNLTFHGVTRRVEGELTIIQMDAHTLDLSGQLTLDVRDFGVTPPKLLMLKVYPEIQVRLKVIATQMG